jgi:hypothetical protein
MNKSMPETDQIRRRCGAMSVDLSDAVRTILGAQPAYDERAGVTSAGVIR